jgi:hypothetical protein
MFEACFLFVHRTFGLNRSGRKGSGLSEKILRKASMPRYVLFRVDCKGR